MFNKGFWKKYILLCVLLLSPMLQAMSVSNFYEVKKERIFTMIEYVHNTYRNNLYSFCTDLAKTGEQVVVWKEIGLSKKGMLDRLSNHYKNEDIFIYAERYVVAVAVYDTDMSQLKTIEERKEAGFNGVFKSCYAVRGSTHPIINTKEMR